MTDSALILGIDLGGTDCKYGIVDSSGKILRKAKHPTKKARGAEGVLELVALHARELMGDEQVATVGMGVPGPMSSREGIVYEAPNLGGWINVPVRDILEKHLGRPVVLNNDANSAAYGEFWIGAGRDVENMILYTLGTGIGGGMVLNGEMYNGPDDTAAELGHEVINFEGPVCGCGVKGCLEAYASATAIRRMVREAIADGRQSTIEMPRDDKRELGAKAVFEAAQHGDAVALEIFQIVGHALGVAAANMINIFNPEMIVYGGAMIGAGDYIFGPLKRTAEANSFDKPHSRCQIRLAELGPDAGTIGAAGLALKRLEATANT